VRHEASFRCRITHIQQTAEIGASISLRAAQFPFCRVQLLPAPGAPSVDRRAFITVAVVAHAIAHVHFQSRACSRLLCPSAFVVISNVLPSPVISSECELKCCKLRVSRQRILPLKHRCGETVLLDLQTFDLHRNNADHLWLLWEGGATYTP
jgi:hypothetical protein